MAEYGAILQGDMPLGRCCDQRCVDSDGGAIDFRAFDAAAAAAAAVQRVYSQSAFEEDMSTAVVDARLHRQRRAVRFLPRVFSP